MNLKISCKALTFCAHFQAKNDIRYYFNGVNVQPMPDKLGGGVLVAATDGHTLGLWHDKKGVTDRQVTIRTTPGLISAAANFFAMRCGAGRPWTIQEHDQCITTHGSARVLKTIPGRYPITQLSDAVRGFAAHNL